MKNGRFTNQQKNGSILISLLIALTMMAILGAGIYTLTTSSSYSELLANNNNNAYDLARAGLRYGVGLQSANFAATTFYLSDSNHTFTLAINNSVITSTGVVNAGTFFEARRTLVYDASWAPQPSSLLSFAKDMPSFGSPIVPNNQQAIQTDQATNTVNLGGGVQDAYGALWYQGSSIAGFCSNGQCSFGTGINVFFEFTFAEDYSNDSTNSADGFTFTVMSAINNTRDRTGGAAPGYSAGELMGYAGPGVTADKLGIKPPKLALEFDPYPNGSGDICSSSSRNDANAGTTSFKNHVALMFWGDRAPSGSSCTFGGVAYPRASFDDNRHGAGGSGDDPQNSLHPASPDPSSGYYEYAGGRGYQCKSSSNTCNWLEDGYTYSARLEITRPTAPSGSVYNYQVKAWIVRRDLAGFTDIQTSHFQDVMVPYGDSTPQINKTVSLAAQDHDDFRGVFLGFTEGTGASTQQVTLANLKMFFPQGTCSYAIFSGDIASPTSANYTVAGGSGTISITTTTVCPWTASSLVPWITLASGTDSGKGNGSVSYTVAANTGSARTGTMTIAGQTFTVNQAAADCPALSITTASLAGGRENVSYPSTTVTASGGVTPYSWSMSGLPNGLSINAATGVISGTPISVGLFNPTITVTDSCPQTANRTYSNVRIKYETYTITNSTGDTIYPQDAGGSCRNNTSISAGGTYSIPYNGAAVSFYQTRGGGNSCSGSSISVSGANADAADTDYNGGVGINSSWQLIDN